MLTINWTLLCHHTESSPNGGEDLIGVSEDYTCATTPVQIDKMTLILCTELSGGISSSINLKLIHNGRILYRTDPATNQLVVQGDSQVIQRKHIPLPFGPVVLPEFGEYTLDVIVDGRTVHTNPFRLLKLWVQ